MEFPESKTLDGDDTWDMQVSDLRKQLCGDPFSEMENNYDYNHESFMCFRVRKQHVENGGLRKINLIK